MPPDKHVNAYLVQNAQPTANDHRFERIPHPKDFGSDLTKGRNMAGYSERKPCLLVGYKELHNGLLAEYNPEK